MPKPETKILPETKVTPDSALEKRTRRTFDVEYKVRILNEAAQCRRGEIGALLRREGLYSSQLNTWRREFEQQGLEGLSKTQPGPLPKTTPEQREIEKLKKQVRYLQRELEISNGCLELQKKALAMLDQIQLSESES